MKSTLRLLLAAMLLGLSIGSLLRAQDQTVPAQSGPSIPPDQSPPPGPGEMPAHMRRMDPHRMLQMLTERLDLTADQQAKVLPLLQAQTDQLRTLRNDTSLANDEKREQARTIMQSTRGQIRAVLTPGQQEKFDNMRPMHGGLPPPPPPSADKQSPAGNPPPPPPPEDNGPPPPTN